MNDIETIYKAKIYVEKLANGINPITDEPIAEGDVLNDIRIVRALFCVSNVMQKVIESGGEFAIKKLKKLPFTITEEQLKGYEYSNKPIALSRVVKKINALVSGDNMKNLSMYGVRRWLMEMALLERVEKEDGSSRVEPTELGKTMGISLVLMTIDGREKLVTCYDSEAQEFILNHIQAIIEYVYK